MDLDLVHFQTLSIFVGSLERDSWNYVFFTGFEALKMVEFGYGPQTQDPSPLGPFCLLDLNNPRPGSSLLKVSAGDGPLQITTAIALEGPSLLASLAESEKQCPPGWLKMSFFW